MPIRQKHRGPGTDHRLQRGPAGGGGCGFRRGDESGDARGSGPGFRQADSEPGKQYVSQLVADIQPVIVHVMAKKLFYSMGEVSEMFDVNASLIRFWETKFDILRPQKNKKGNRLFSPADVENLKLIYHLVKERGMTLDGAARCLKQNKGTISRDAELLERLQRVRALLEEVRAELKESAEDRAVVAENGAGEAAEVSALPVRTRKKPAAQELADDAGGDGAESKGPVQVIEPGPRSEKPAPKRSAARQPRRISSFTRNGACFT
mgnify:FL=1